MESFEDLVKELRRLQMRLRPDLRTDQHIRDKLYLACRRSPECNLAVFKPATTFQKACADIRSALSIRSETTTTSSAFSTDETLGQQQQSSPFDQFYADRRINYSQNSKRGTPQLESRSGSGSKGGKQCFVCRRIGC
jgi:hypothetical protein